MNEESRYQELEMDLKQIIKEEWEKEFPEQLSGYEKSVMKLVYEEIILSVARRVWNAAILKAMQNARLEYAEVDVEGFSHREPVGIDYTSIAKLMINEQGTDTTQI